VAVLAASVIKGRFLKGIDPSSTTDDVAIEATVDAADALICASLGLPENTSGVRTLAQSSYVVWLRSPRVNRRRLWLPVLGSGTIDSVKVEVGASTETIDATYYEQRGRVLYRKVGLWPDEPGPILRLTLSSWGFASLDTTHPLGVAIGMLVAHLWNAPKTQGLASISAGGKSVGVRDGDAAIPPNVAKLIAPYAVSVF
jgi:hypothetical protein